MSYTIHPDRFYHLARKQAQRAKRRERYWRIAMMLASFSCLILALTGCDRMERAWDELYAADPIDRDLGLTRNDYENMHDGDKGSSALQSTRPGGMVPDLATVLAAPRPPKIGETKLVSIAVTDDVPLKDVLIELSKLADVDLEMDANIQGGISFRAKDRPFNEVIERISDLAGLRYKYAGGILRVERDLPYINNYPLDFLNLTRTVSSNVSITTDILSISANGGAQGGAGGAGAGGGAGGGGAGGNQGGGLTTGSSTSISTQGEDDFWQSLETSVRAILLHEAPRFLSGDANGVAALAGALPANAQGITGAGSVPVAAPAAAAGAIPGAAGGAAGGAQVGVNQFFVVNKQAGVMSVAATQRQHESIKLYLDFLKRSAAAQVLIEAKVVEVELDKEFQSGIDWNLIQQNIGSGNWDIASNFGPDIDSSNIVRFALNPNDPDANINAVLNLTERFGTTRTLSSPRLHAINNQPAVLTFAENRVFFEVDVEREPDTIDANGVRTPGQTTVNTQRSTIPIGIIMTILPSINLDANEVTLSVRPTLTRQVAEVVDPGSAYASEILIDDPTERFTNTIPVVEVRELDSIMRLRSGQVMVIGGLMEQVNGNTDNGIPFLSEIPFVGNLFKGVTKQDNSRELIIFIRASIVSSEGNYDDADRKIYQRFTNDPRPIAF